ncbi:MAG: dihydroneopterin aldolase [Elusimicrobia bacterium]|nr:dihydroneopterin aldolase [Elusimicrobiota bacterium]
MKNAGRILLLGVECRPRLGVPEWERKKPQKVLVDVELTASLAKAASSDDVRDSIDYWEVEKRVRAAAERGSFKLVERLADRLAREVLDYDRRVAAVLVRVHKTPAVMPRTREIVVELSRRR